MVSPKARPAGDLSLHRTKGWCAAAALGGSSIGAQASLYSGRSVGADRAPQYAPAYPLPPDDAPFTTQGGPLTE